MFRLRVSMLAAAAACLLAAPASADTGTYTLRAVVGKFGALGRHGGGVVSSQLVGRGSYLVTFASDIDACTIVGTIGRATTAGGPPWNAAFISATAAGVNSNQVVVLTGGVGGRPRDHAFHLLVACQPTG
jgi:hypothetical protein